MGAFQTGFQLGQRAFQQAVENKERQEQRKADAEERALRLKQIQMGLDAAERASEREKQVDALAQKLASPNAENYTLAQAESKGGLRVPSAAAADPKSLALTSSTPSSGSGIRMPAQSAPAGSVGMRAMPDTRQATFNLPPTKTDVEDILARMAILKGDASGFRAAMSNKQAMAADELVSSKMKEYTGSEEQIGASAAWLNEFSPRVTMGQPDKNGMVRISVVRPDKKAEFMRLSKADQAKLYAASHLLDVDPMRAMSMISDVSRTLATAVAADNGLEAAIASNSNDVAGKSATITHQGRSDARAAATESRAAAADARDIAKLRKDEEDKRHLREANAILESAIQRGDPVAIRQARRALLLAGGTLPDSEGVKADFKPNPMGMGGTAVQRQPNGSIVITPVGPDGRPGAPVNVPQPGARATGGLANDTRALAIRNDPTLTIGQKRDRLRALGYE